MSEWTGIRENKKHFKINEIDRDNGNVQKIMSGMLIVGSRTKTTVDRPITVISECKLLFGYYGTKMFVTKIK